MNATVKTPSHFTFKKEERLSGKKIIDGLFKNGSSFYLKPFKIIFLKEHFTSPTPENLLDGSEPKEKSFPARILISVPARNFKRAVDRNKIKRLIRESYRLNKQVLYNELNKEKTKLIVAFLYTSKTIEPFNFIQQKVIVVLNQLAKAETVVEKLNK